MPYFLAKRGAKTCVVKGTKDDPGETVKCHTDAEKATAHLRALYAAEEKMSLAVSFDALPDVYIDALAPTWTVSGGVGGSASTTASNIALALAQKLDARLPANGAAEVRGERVRLYFREGEQTPDRRVIDPNSINFDRPPPYPIALQTVRAPEHQGAVVCGVIDRVMRDGTAIVAEGRLDLNSQAGQEAERLIREGFMATWSPDLGAATVDIEIGALDEDSETPQEEVAHFVKATFLGATLVQMPALASAMIDLLDAEGNTLVAAPARDVAMTQAVAVSTNPEENTQIVERTDETLIAAAGCAPRDGAGVMMALEGGPGESDHLTLAFLGCADELGEKVKQATAQALRPFSSDLVTAQVAGHTHFAENDDGEVPCVLLLSSPELDTLRAAVTDALEAVGVDYKKDWGFIPHTTLGYHKPGECEVDPESVPDNFQLSGPQLWWKHEKVAFTIESIAACAGPTAPPKEFFDNPELDEPQRWVTITDDGRIYGTAAAANECHIGYLDRCVDLSLLEGEDFTYAMPGHVVCADGSKVATGPIAIKGGHADTGLDAMPALAHYDNPATAVADVCYYWGAHGGIDFSGVLRPTATAEQVRILRASGVSMDAREIDGRLRYLATCSVNTPGFPKAKARLVSSVEGEEPAVVALIAAGGAPESADDCGCDSTSSDAFDVLLARVSDDPFDALLVRIPTDDDFDSLQARVDAL